MYTPTQFKITDEKTINDFIQKYSFATIITHSEAGLEATHVPVLFDQQKKQLSFHVASGNTMANIFQADGCDVLIIFQGPHGYISPRWLKQPGLPTWNYTSIHAYGKVQKIIDSNILLNELKKMIHQYDNNSVFDSTLTEARLGGINGYQIKISKLQAKFKLGQTLETPSIKNVITELLSSSLASDRELGAFMQAYYNH